MSSLMNCSEGATLGKAKVEGRQTSGQGTKGVNLGLNLAALDP